MFGFLCFFKDIWVVDPTFPAKKNKKQKNPIGKRLGRDTFNTCAKKNPGLVSKKRRGRLDFRAVKCENHGLAS